MKASEGIFEALFIFGVIIISIIIILLIIPLVLFIAWLAVSIIIEVAGFIIRNWQLVIFLDVIAITAGVIVYSVRNNA